MSRADHFKTFLALLFCTSLSFLSCQKNDNRPLPTAAPESVGMSSEHLSLISSLLQEAIDRGDTPGAVILVARKGKVIMNEAFGESQRVPESRPLGVSMLFDVASLTKPVATATSIMILVERGRIRLWDCVNEFIPGFAPYVDENGKQGKDARLWHLLTHTSGLPPDMTVDEVADTFGRSCSLEEMVDHIGSIKKLDSPGNSFHYSCLGFIVLGAIVEKVSGKPISEFAEEHIFKPLSMNNTFFCPSEEDFVRCIPTLIIEGSSLKGIVHDHKARALGGVSGNAGLFSTAEDLAVFAQMMLNKGEYRGVRILNPLTVERMTSVFPEAAFSGRGLGWDLDSAYSTNGGDIFGPRSYGHTGYTGTSIWIDPDTQTFIILLTNSVHPDDTRDVISLRSKVANVVASSIDRNS